MIRSRRLGLVAALLVVIPEAIAASESSPERSDVTLDVGERLRLRLELAEYGALAIGDDPVRTVTSTRRFYEGRGFEPAWLDGDRVDRLLDALDTLRSDGLEPDVYHHARLLERWTDRDADLDRVGARVDVELLATDGYLLAASHLLAGQVDPEALDPEWVATRRERDLVRHLDAALTSGDLGGSLIQLRPDHAGYDQLREQLDRLRGWGDPGWPAVPPGPALRPGDGGDRVRALAERLGIDPATMGAAEGDSLLWIQVTAFQRRHGLEPDAIVGPETLAALNVSARDRARQVMANLERWRWLPENLGSRYVLVNIADYRLSLVENGTVVIDFPVVVGKAYRRTPVFSGSMTYLVFNPTWEVPPGIIRADILPTLRRDPSYLERMGMQVLRGWGADETIIDPATVEWSRVQPGAYRFRAAPGPANPLGRVKFMFPNRFSVYLHDTPARELFARTRRAFSSGCIRLAEPATLAGELLADHPGWTADAIDSAMAGGGGPETVRLPRAVPVHLLYWTAWVDGDGVLQLRPDIYGRDAALVGALDVVHRIGHPAPADAVPDDGASSSGTGPR